MLVTVFSKLIEISFQVSFFILAILLIRICFKRLPKRYLCFLWTLVALRLLFPIEINSPFSLIPDTDDLQSRLQAEIILPQHTIPEINMPKTDVPLLPNTTQENNSEVEVLPDSTDANTPIVWNSPAIFSALWCCGMMLLLSYGFISYLRTKLQLREAVHDAENIWYCADIPSPFVMGYIKPRIYIPFSITKEQLPYIIAHEKSHITHLDHLSKLLGYILLCVYWLNPFIWVAYFYYCKDLELACDERVILQLGDSERKPYSEALLTCSVTNKALLQSPLSFSELAIKERIINILKYKKLGFWGLLAAAVICIVSVVCLLTTPSKPSENEPIEETNFSGTEEIIAHYADYDELLKALADDFVSLAENGKRFYVCPGWEIPSLTTLNKVSDIQLFFYTLEENMNYTIGKSSLTLMRTYKGYDVYKQENIILDNITSAEDYIGYPNLYFYTDLLAVAEINHPEANATEQSLRDLIIGYYCNDGRYTELDDSFALFAPDTALKALLPLSDGTLEVFPGKDDLHKLVCYTFTDGSQLTFVMETDGPASTIGGNAFWFPQSGGVYTTSHAALEAQKTEAFTLQATTEDLKHAQEGFSDATDYLYTLPDAFSPDLFCKVAETSDSSVILYGLRNCNSLILQDGDNRYPIFMRWYLNRSILPEIYKNDYDDDGDYEYAIYSLENSGSEAEIMRLTMLEVVDGTLVMEIFDNSRLYDYINVIDKFGNKFTCGSFIYFEERNGQWWVRTSARVLQGTSTIPDLSQSVTLEAPLTYYDHHMYSNRYFDIGEVSVVGTLDNDLYSQLDAFPGKCSVDVAGNLITTISVIDYECAMTTSSYTGETVYHWSSPKDHSLSPKTYPLEIRDGNVQEVPAKVVTEEELSKYTFGKNLIAQAYQAFPSGIKQYILRENGTIHVNIGYEADDFLNLQYMTFQISEDRQTATLSDYGMGYYLLHVNDVAGLNAFRDTFTGKNHFLPSDTTQLPWEWLITMNGEKYYKPQLKVEDTPVILHDYDFESLPHQNLHNFYHGFYASEIRANGTYYIELRYQDGTDEITILTDNHRKVVSITVNGQEMALSDQEHHLYYGVGGSYGILQYMDVTGDGVQELVFESGYRTTNDCYVYNIDSMKQLSFEKDASAIMSDLNITLGQFTITEDESSISYEVTYGEETYTQTFEFSKTSEYYPELLSISQTTDGINGYFNCRLVPDIQFICYQSEKQCFEATLYIVHDHPMPIPDIFSCELRVNYIWDAKAEMFVLDLDSVQLHTY